MKRGFTILELLCATAITLVLVALLSVAVGKAYKYCKRSAQTSAQWHNQRIKVMLQAEWRSEADLLHWLTNRTYTNKIEVTTFDIIHYEPSN